MRNLKKLIAVFVTVAMIAALVTVPVSAVEMDDALKLETMGVLKGTGNGVDAAYRASQPTRYQAAWLFLRLLGREDDAQAWAGTLNFADAATAKNAAGNPLDAANQKMLAYLYAHQNLGYRGYTDDTFRPFVLVTAQMYYKLMLVALGYVEGTDFTWDNVLDKAVEFGLITTKPDNAAAFTIDSLATATVAALQADLKDGTKTLVAKLVEDDKSITAASATAAGVYEIPVVALAVTGVTANELGEILVAFNVAANSALLNTAGNVTVKGALPTASNAAVVLSADGKSAAVTVPEAQRVANGGTYTLVIKSAVGLAADYNATVRVFDTALPTVTSIDLTAPNKFVITFSETLGAANGLVRINNGLYGITGLVKAGKTVEVTLASASLPAGTYSVEVSNYNDLAGFVMAKETLSWAYAPDTTLPTATVVSATQTAIVVEFSEAVTGTTTMADFYHTFSTYVAQSVTRIGTTNQYTVVFTTNPIPAGTTTFTIKTGHIADAWGNKMLATSFPVTVTADTTAPTVTEVKFVNDKTVKVYFDEAVDAATAQAASNYTVSLGSSTYTPNGAAYDAVNKVVTLTWNVALAGGRYNIGIKNIKDVALVPNTMADYSGLFTVTDTSAINIAAVTATIVKGATNDVIYLTYPEAMNATALDTSFYMIKHLGVTSLLTAKTVTIEANGATGYKITRATDANLQPGDALVIGRVQDLAGNAIAAFSFEVAIVAEAAPAVVAGSFKQTSASTFSITFNKTLAADAPITEAFSFWVGGVYHMPAFSTAVSASNTTTVNFTLTADCVTALNTAAPTYAANTAMMADDIAGVAILLDGDKIISSIGMAAVDADLTGTVVDGRAPVYVSKEERVVGGKLGTVLNFSEPIADVSSAYFANDLVVKAGTTTLIAGIGYSTTWDAGDVVVFGSGTLQSIASPLVIKDAAGNKAAAFAQTTETAILLRGVYDASMDPVYNLADQSGVGPKEAATFALGATWTGTYQIDFDMTATAAGYDSSVSFTSLEVLPLYRTDYNAHYYSHHTIMIAMVGGFIRAINGGAFYVNAGDTFSAVTVGERYHIRITVDHLTPPAKPLYKVFITPASTGVEGQLGTAGGVTGGFLFRTRGQVAGDEPANTLVPNAQNTAAVIVSGNVAGNIKMENLVVTDIP